MLGPDVELSVIFLTDRVSLHVRIIIHKLLSEVLSIVYMPLTHE